MLDRDLDGKPVKGVRAAEGSLAEWPCSTATSRSMAAFRELSHHLSPSATFNFHHLSSLCPFQPGHVRWNGETEKLSVHTSKRVSLRPASHSRSRHNPASWMMFSSDSFICSSTHKMTEFSVLLLHLLLSTPPSHFFLPFAVLRVREKPICQVAGSWRRAQWWWALQGPCSTWLGSHLCWEYARLWEICLSEVH